MTTSANNNEKLNEPPVRSRRSSSGQKGAPQVPEDGNDQRAHPVSILITADTTTQARYLNERCLQLEAYCRDLIKTNKVLDMENKLCITQILNLTNANQGGTNQLNNFVSALNLMKNKSEPITYKGTQDI